jgi:hypothetical protein
MKQVKIYLAIALLFVAIAFTSCAGSRGGYNCPATKGMSGYR